MLNRNNFQIASLASTDAGRYSTDGIKIEPDRTIVTDGTVLVIVTQDDIKPEDYPVIEGFDPAPNFNPFIISRKAALDIAKSIPKCSIPVLNRVNVGQPTNGNGSRHYAALAVTDLEHHLIHRPAISGDSFPNPDSVMPKGAADRTVGINPKLLGAVLAQFVKAGAENVRLDLYADNPHPQPVKLSANLEDGQSITALIMPMSLPK